MTSEATCLPSPWPINQLVARLTQDDFLYNLTGPRQKDARVEQREKEPERLVHATFSEVFGGGYVTKTSCAGRVLGVQAAGFPANTEPDIIVTHGNHFHFCELKASRTDYDRFDSVFQSRPFQQFLKDAGHFVPNVWEVEQDLLKLYFYKDLAPNVGSCLFMMVDGYAGGGRSWSEVFASKTKFIETMRTELVKGWADRLLDRTRIIEIRAAGATARLILVEVHPGVHGTAVIKGDGVQQSLQQQLTVYLASPLGFSRENDDYRGRIKRRLSELGYRVLDPWDKEEVEERFRAALSMPDGAERRDAIKEAASYAGKVNADAIRESDLVLAVLDGTEPDSGTVAEVGFGAGIGKRCYGLRTDFRDCGDLPGLALNLQLQYFIDESGGRLFRSIREIDFG